MHLLYPFFKNLNYTFFEIETSDGEISLIHILPGSNTNFEYYFKSLNGEWEYSNNPFSIYIQDLHQQMLYAKELRHIYQV